MCYMDTDIFIVHVKTEYIYKDISEDVEKTCDTSNYELDGPLSIVKNKVAVSIVKDELGEEIMRKILDYVQKAAVI